MGWKKTLMTVLFVLAVLFMHGSDIQQSILLRAPLLSDKNSIIISNGLYEMEGIQNIEACLELRVVIITYDPLSSASSTSILEKLHQLEINTSFEQIYETDIPVIRKNYKVISFQPPVTEK